MIPVPTSTDTGTYEYRYRYLRVQIPVPTSTDTGTYKYRYRYLRVQIPVPTSTDTGTYEYRYRYLRVQILVPTSTDTGTYQKPVTGKSIHISLDGWQMVPVPTSTDTGTYRASWIISSVSDPDPHWICIQQPQGYRSGIRFPNADPGSSSLILIFFSSYKKWLWLTNAFKLLYFTSNQFFWITL